MRCCFRSNFQLMNFQEALGINVIKLVGQLPNLICSKCNKPKSQHGTLFNTNTNQYEYYCPNSYFVVNVNNNQVIFAVNEKAVRDMFEMHY